MYCNDSNQTLYKMKDVIIDFENHSVRFTLNDNVRLSFNVNDDNTTDISLVDKNLITADFKYNYYDLVHSSIINYSKAKDAFEAITNQALYISSIIKGYDNCLVGRGFRPCNLEVLANKFTRFIYTKQKDLISAKIHEK